MEYIWIVIGIAFISFIVFKPEGKDKTKLVRQSKTNFSYTFENNSEVKFEEGEKVKLWNRVNTNKVNFYAKGYHSGEGLIGVKKNKIIVNHLKSSGKYRAEIAKKMEFVSRVDIELLTTTE